MRRNPQKSGVVRILSFVIVAFAASIFNLDESVGQVIETVNTLARPNNDAWTPIAHNSSSSLPFKATSSASFPAIKISQTPTEGQTDFFEASPTEKITLASTPTDLPTTTPTYTNTPKLSPIVPSTQTPTATNLPTVTLTHTNIPEPSSTASSTQAPTATDTPTSTSTDTPSPVPSSSASLTQTPTASHTPTSTSIDTPSPVPSSSASPTQAPTATHTPTSTSTDTPSPLPSSTASSTQAPTATHTPTSTSTKTSSPSPTLEPSPSPTRIPDNFSQWSKVEIAFTGPISVGMSDKNNPFKIMIDVTFIGPGGQTFDVPGFYDGDGMGGLDGDVWKVRFSPNKPGAWSYSTISSNGLLDGLTGQFNVTAPSGCQPYSSGSLPDFSCTGRLDYVGEHYLKFDNGTYWLKGGADEPEDFLAPGSNAGFRTKEQAINYLAERNVNSIYLMLHNIQGDGRNVWPWVGLNETEAMTNHEHFDVTKLTTWEALFTYIQSKGLVLHLVFEDDSAWTGFNREMYYREMIARFGHHNGIIWNISEEYNEIYSANQVKNFAQLVRDLDPYNHPITVHHAGGLDVWIPFLGDPRFDLTSFQTSPTQQNASAVSWFTQVEQSGRVIPISFDETGQLKSNERDLTRHIVWSVYLGGANFELFSVLDSGYQAFANHFEDMHRARGFVEELPIAQMRPMNNLLVSGQGYVFAKAGEVYAVYLPSGGPVEVNLTDTSGILQVEWFNPRTGEHFGQTPITGGEIQAFTPPFSGDAVLSISAE